MFWKLIIKLIKMGIKYSRYDMTQQAMLNNMTMMQQHQQQMIQQQQMMMNQQFLQNQMEMSTTQAMNDMMMNQINMF